MLEVERTYAVEGDAALPDLAGDGLTASGEETVHLVAGYHDTRDLRLARSRVTLRRRTGGKDAGWHLKLPAGRDREEVQRPLGRGSAVPADLVALTRSRTRGAPLVPVVELRTTRHLVVLTDADGNRVEVADDRVTAVRAGTGPETDRSVSWREVEAELLGDSDPRVLDAVEQRLLAAGARPADWPSKLARALATAPGGGQAVAGGGAEPSPTGPEPSPTGPEPSPTGPEPSPTGAEPSPGGAEPSGDVAALLDYVTVQVDTVVDRDALVRLDRPDAVHAMRVATRRLRSTLRTFAGLLDPAAVEGLDDDLRELAAVLGRVRDREVVRDRFARTLAAQPGAVLGVALGTASADAVAGRLVAGSTSAADPARRALLAVLDGDAHVALLDRLVALTGPGVLTPAGRDADRSALLALVAGARRTLARRMRRVLPDPASDPASERGSDPAVRPRPPRPDAVDEELHRARKAAKRARYAAEAVTPLVGAAAQRYVDGVKDLQEVLGDHQDSVAAREVLLTTGSRGGFAAGLLYRDEEERAAAARALVPAVWHAADRRRVRRWLR